MPNRLQNLLGIAPLENLRKRRGQGTSNLMNTDLQNQVGFSQGGLAPLNQVSPLQSSANLLEPVSAGFYQTQMQNRGFESPLLDTIPRTGTGVGTGAGKGGFTGTGISGDMGGGGDPETGTQPGGAHDKFYTDPGDLLSSFLSAMPDKAAQAQWVEFLGPDSAEGPGLSMDEYGALMGFDIRHIQANTHGIREKLQVSYDKYQSQFGSLQDDLRNVQEYRTDLFGTVGTKSEMEAASILGMTQAGSTSGVESGRRREVMQEGIQTLDEVLRKQLVDAESQYFGQLEGLYESYVTTFQDQMKSIQDDLLKEHPNFEELLKWGTTESGEGSQVWNLQRVITEVEGSHTQYQDMWADFINLGGSVELQNYISEQYASTEGWNPSFEDIMSWISNWLDNY